MPFTNHDPNLANIGKEKYKDKLNRAGQNQQAQETMTSQQNEPKGIAKLLHFFKSIFSKRA